jgi:hypothetical protein
VLEHIREQDHIEAVIAERRMKIELLGITDDYALTILSSELGSLWHHLDSDDGAAMPLLQDARHVTRRAPELEYA